MYYIEKENKIIFADEDRKRLVNTALFVSDFSEEDIQEGELELGYDDNWYRKGEAPKQNISVLKDKKLKQTESEFTSAISIITPYYTADEKDTFYKQESQAKYYLTEKEAGREPDVTKITHISAIAQERGVTLDEIVAKIMAKVSAFEIASGRLMGVKQKVEDMVEKVNNEEELNSINPHDIIYTVLNNIIEKMSK